MDKLAVLIPPQRRHRHRYHGVLAPNAPLRQAVTAYVGLPKGDQVVSANQPPVADEDLTEAGFKKPFYAASLQAILIARIYDVTGWKPNFDQTCLNESEQAEPVPEYEFDQTVSWQHHGIELVGYSDGQRFTCASFRERTQNASCPPKNPTMVESSSSNTEGINTRSCQKVSVSDILQPKIGWKVALKFLSIQEGCQARFLCAWALLRNCRPGERHRRPKPDSEKGWRFLQRDRAQLWLGLPIESCPKTHDPAAGRTAPRTGDEEDEQKLRTPA